jgi:Protein of unknown function (DUF1598)
MRALAESIVRAAARRATIFGCAILPVLLGLAWSEPALAQGSVSSVSLTPFVTGLIPVVGPRGGVGGVSIDAAGVVARSDVESLGRLREARIRALTRISDDLAATSPLRKISLRGLAAAIDQLRQERRPVSDELQNLAGLQRVQFVFVFPERHDIVLAGFAEGWKVDSQGNVVGQTTGQPALQLDDLIVALRTAKNANTQSGITCSMDPTKEGAQRLQRLLGTRGQQWNEAAIARLEESLGPQQITLTGVPPSSHFAHVLVAADFMLKRLGMNFEPAPIAGMPSYMELLQAPAAPTPRNAMPRFWLAPCYDPILQDPAGLAWQLRGSGVQAEAEEGRLGAQGKAIVARGKENSPAHMWAETMTAKYDALAAALPIFAELRNCMDLAVVAALLLKEDLPVKAGCDLALLLDDERIKVAEYHVPQTVDSRASLIRKGQQWIVGVSGGVEIDSWAVVSRTEVRPDLADKRKQAESVENNRWWWD